MSGRGVDDILAELLGDDEEDVPIRAEAGKVATTAHSSTTEAAAHSVPPAHSLSAVQSTAAADAEILQNDVAAVTNASEPAHRHVIATADSLQQHAANSAPPAAAPTPPAAEAAAAERVDDTTAAADALLLALGVDDAPAASTVARPSEPAVPGNAPAAGALPQGSAAAASLPASPDAAVVLSGAERAQLPASSQLLGSSTGQAAATSSTTAVQGQPAASAATQLDAVSMAGTGGAVAAAPTKHPSADLEPVLSAAMNAVTAAITTTTCASGLNGAAAYRPLAALNDQLASASADWNPRGRPDNSGSMIGGAVLMKLEALSAIGPADIAGYVKPHGRPQAIAAAGQYVALGMPNSVTVIVQLPTAQHAQHGSGAIGTAGAPAGPQTAAAGSVHVCGEVRSGEAVNALGFSWVATAGEPLWLAVAHHSGTIALWDMQRRGPRLVTNIAGQGVPISCVSFLPSRGTSSLLAADIRGHLHLHSISSSLLRTSVSTKLLLDGQHGPVLAMQHLTPFVLEVPRTTSSSPQAGPAAAAADAGGLAAAGAAAVSPRAANSAAADGRAGALLDGPWRVGEGVFLLVTPTHCYIARLKPVSGDLLLLYSIPQPSPAQLHIPSTADGAQGPIPLPAAAWLPHHRKQAAATKAHGQLVIPVAQLALAWGPRLVLFDVPLIGDHLDTAATGSAAGAGGEAAGGPSLSPAGLRLPTPGRATSSSTNSNATLEALTPAMASQLTGFFGLALSTMWCGCSKAAAAAAANGGGGGGGGSPRKGGAGKAAAGSDVGPVDPMPILGLHWMDHDALSVVAQQGLSSLVLVLDSSFHVKEQVEWMDVPLSLPVVVPGVSPGYASSVVGLGPRLYLLGSQGVVCGRLLSWSERLKTLQDIGKWRLGLSLALRFYTALQRQQHQQPGASKQPAVGGKRTASSKAPSGGLARCEGAAAEAPQMEQWMLSLLLGYIQAMAGSPTTGTPEQQLKELQQATAVAVSCCLLLQRPQVLFERVFPLVSRSTHAGAVGCLVTALEPAVLADLLPVLPPEVMQALVDHFAGAGELDRVERCVLRMSITSLDLNQVIRLCEEHQLYSALTYVYSQIRDFRRPVLDLLAAVAAAGDQGEAQRYGFLLLVYLQGAFQGQGFPPGSGSVVDGRTTLDEIKATLLGVILFLGTQDLLREWRSSGRMGRAAVAAALAPPESAAAAAGGAPGSGGPRRLLQDPHPALRLLLGVDVAATIQVLAQATEGWDAVETDLRAAAGKPAEELESVMVATQVVVNALVSLLEDGSLSTVQQPHEGPNSSNSSSSSSSSRAANLHVVRDYVLSLACSGRVRVKPSYVLLLLKQLAEESAAAAEAAVAAAPGSPAQRSAAATQAHAEDCFVQLIEQTGINTDAQLLQRDSLSAKETAEAQELAVSAGFLLASAAIHHQLGEYSQAVQCLLQRQAAAPSAVFDYAHKHLSSALTTAQRQQFKKSIMQHVAPLVVADAEATAALMCQHVSQEEQLQALQLLAAEPQLQFNLLNAIMQLESAVRRTMADSLGDSSHAAPGGGTTAAVAAVAAASGGSRQGLLDRPQVVDMYIQLLAKFQPSAVLRFLQGHEGYDVQAAVQLCQAAGVADAEAYLHERLGNYEAALRLHLARATAANAALEAALLGGRLPLLHLPAWAAGLGYGAAVAPPAAATPVNAGQSSSSSSQGSNRPAGSAAAAEAAALQQLLQLPFGMGVLIDKLLQILKRQAAAARPEAAAGATADASSGAAAPCSLSEQHQLVVEAAAAWLHRQLAPGSSKQPAGLLKRGPKSTGPQGHSSSRAGAHHHQQTAASGRMQGGWPSAEPPAGQAGSQMTQVPGQQEAAPGSHSPAASAAGFLIAQLLAGVRLSHQGWLLALSPRTQLPSNSSGSAGGGPLTTAAAGTRAAPGGEGAAAAGAALDLAPPASGPLPPPTELMAAWHNLQEVLACCCRISRSAAKSQELHEAQRCWFTLMDCYVQCLRSQQASSSSSTGSTAAVPAGSQQQPNSGSSFVPPGQLTHPQRAVLLDSLEQAAACGDSRGDAAQLLGQCCTLLARTALRDCYAFMLDDVISRMADHVPLLEIVTWVLNQHGRERFGDFRSTLLGLFSAYAYEFNIMRAANLLITKDAWRKLWARYAGLSSAVPEVQVEEGASAAGGEQEAGGGQLMEVAPAVAQRVAAAMDKLLSASDAMQGALHAGVIRTGGLTSSSSKLGSIHGQWLELERQLSTAAEGAGSAAQSLTATQRRSGYAAAAVAARTRKAGEQAVLRAAVDLARERGRLMGRGSSWAGNSSSSHLAAKTGATGGESSTGGVTPAGSSLQGMQGTAAADDFDVDELLSWSMQQL